MVPTPNRVLQMPILESDFQAKLIRRLEKSYPEAIVIKTDPRYIQGMPDLLILYYDMWAALECKQGPRSRRQPNQEWYVDTMSQMSFAAFISPDNEESVLHALEQTFRDRR